MNTILQKRIEEAANITVQNLYDYAKQTRNPEVSKYDEGYLDAIDVQGDFLFREGANYALSNQWISVEEALPPYDDRLETISIDVIVRNEYGKATSAWYDYANKVWHLSYGEIAGDDVLDSKITHWMSIPSLKEGEK